jgi:hypothetical protein
LARDAGFAFRAVAADSAYGDQDGFHGELAEAGLPFVMALKPRCGTWPTARTRIPPVDAARALARDGPPDPGDWRPVTRTFRDGHTETWWAAEARLGWWGPDGLTRLVVATADPGTLPDKATWYLATNPKLRPVRWAVRGLTWCFAGLAGWRSGYFKVSGIGAPRSVKASRWVLVGSVSIGTVAWVPAKRTWLRVRVARCSSRPRKL